jgi:hypothetical protein
MPADSSSFRLCADVRYRQLADEGIVLRQKAGEVLVLNEVGVRVVALLDEGLAPPGIVARLVEEFDAEPGRLAADVADFMAELATAGVIEEEPPP